jgi:hypothetical protein
MGDVGLVGELHARIGSGGPWICGEATCVIAIAPVESAPVTEGRVLTGPFAGVICAAAAGPVGIGCFSSQNGILTFTSGLTDGRAVALCEEGWNA